jgi:hypothetical protein
MLQNVSLVLVGDHRISIQQQKITTRNNVKNLFIIRQDKEQNSLLLSPYLICNNVFSYLWD